MPGTILLEPILLQSSTGNLLFITSTGRIETEIKNEPTIIVGNTPSVTVSGTPTVIVTSSGVVHTQVDNIPHVIITSSGIINVNIHDGVGNAISSEQILDGTRALNVNLTQNLIISTANSSTTNIAANSYFTGTAESTLGVNSIQVTAISSNNGILYVQQSTDGVYWDVEDSFILIANFSYSLPVQATAAYCRVLFYNQNNSATLFFRLQTVLCPILDILPRSLSKEGNLKVAIAEHFPTKIEGTSEKIMMSDISVRRLLNDILCELQQMNIHMNQITDLNLNEYDSDKF